MSINQLLNFKKIIHESGLPFPSFYINKYKQKLITILNLIIMKNSILLIAFLLCTMFSFAQVSVKGYYRSNGTYVQAHQRTVPNATRNDNYSTVGNTNPYTGKAGTVPRDGYYTTPSSTNIPTYTSSTTSTYYPSSTTYRGDTKMPYYPPNPTTTYSIPSTTSSKTIYTGPRGGQYYINSNGNKTYVPRN